VALVDHTLARRNKRYDVCGVRLKFWLRILRPLINVIENLFLKRLFTVWNKRDHGVENCIESFLDTARQRLKLVDCKIFRRTLQDHFYTLGTKTSRIL